MLIDIPDDVSPNERHRLLKLYPIAYALCIHDFNVRKASDWLAISSRWVHVLLKTDKVLKHLTNKLSETYIKQMELARQAEVADIWAKCRAQMIEKFRRSFDYHQMSESQRQKVIDNINRIYS